MQRAKEAALTRYYIGESTWTRRLGLILAFNVLIVISSYLRIPLPFTLVPITGQTAAVLACGLFLGPTAGALTVMAYLSEGAMGLPVFAGGAAGMVTLMGPTGGYLIGFVVAAFMTGLMSERIKSMTYTRLLMVLTISTATIFACGLIQLSIFVPREQLLLMGLYPFLPGAVMKIIVVASGLSLYKRARRAS